MDTKVSEKTFLRVCYAVAVIIITVIAGCSYCVAKVINSLQ